MFGELADTGVDEMLRPLVPHAEAFVLTTPPNPKAMAPEMVAKRLPAGMPAEIEPARARGEVGVGGLLVACGSIYLLGEQPRDWPEYLARFSFRDWPTSGSTRSA